MRKLLFLSFLIVNSTFAFTITEIMYNPEGNDLGREWIEVINDSSETITILSGKNGWRINDGKNHFFEENLTVYPQEIFVIIQDKNLFLQDYPNFQGKTILANFSLKNEVGKIQIFDEQKNLITEISYSSSCGGQNNNYSIFFENNVCKENKIKGGTPGNLLVQDEIEKEKFENKDEIIITSIPKELKEFDSRSIQTSSILYPLDTISSNTYEIIKETKEKSDFIKPTLIISEFLPNPEGNDEDKEFVEIFNYGDEIIDLDSFYLKIGTKKINLKGKIEPQEYFVILNKDNNFYIRNQGENLALYFNDQEIFSISYKGKAPEGKSFSRKENEEWEFSEPTPGKENIFIFSNKKINNNIIDENIKEFKHKFLTENINKELELSSKLAQTKNLILQENEEKNRFFYVFGGLIIILLLVFFIWLKL